MSTDFEHWPRTLTKGELVGRTFECARAYRFALGEIRLKRRAFAAASARLERLISIREATEGQSAQARREADRRLRAASDELGVHLRPQP